MLTGYRLGKDLARITFKISYKDFVEFDHYNASWKIKEETRIYYRNLIPVGEICFFLADMLSRNDVETFMIDYHGSREKDGSNCWVKIDKTIMMF